MVLRVVGPRHVLCVNLGANQMANEVGARLIDKLLDRLCDVDDCMRFLAVQLCCSCGMLRFAAIDGLMPSRYEAGVT